MNETMTVKRETTAQQIIKRYYEMLLDCQINNK